MLEALELANNEVLIPYKINMRKLNYAFLVFP